MPVAPDGTTTAELFTRTETANGRAYQYVTKSAVAETYTFSIHAKKSVGDYFAMRMQGTWPGRAEAVFNLETGAVHSTAATTFTSPLTQIESLPNGWYRLSMTSTTDTATSIYSIFSPNSNGTTASNADSVTNSAALIWGAQLEKTFNSPRTYLPTTTDAVFEPTKRTSLNSFVEIQKNRSAIETWAWRFNDYDKEYAVSTTATYQDIRAQTGTNNWLSHAIRIAPDAGTAAGAVSHGFATGHTVVTHGLTSSRYAVLLFPRANGDIHFYHPDLAAGKLLVLNSDAGEITSDAIRDITTTSFSIDSGVAQGVYDYLVLEDGGLAAMGTYVGNNSSAGPYISLPHSSALFTRRSAATCSFWTNNSKSPGFNENGNYTRWNDAQAEGTGSLKIDMLAGAVKIRDAYADQNSSGVTYYYISLGELSGGGDLPPIYGR